jgi:hypothetical protein
MSRFLWTAEYAISLLLVVVAALYWSAPSGGGAGLLSRDEDVIRPIRNEVDVRVRDFDDRIERELKISRLRVGTLLDAEFEESDRQHWIQETMANHDHLLQTLAFRLKPRPLVGPLPPKHITPLAEPVAASPATETMVLFPFESNQAGIAKDAILAMDRVAGFHPDILGDTQLKFWLLQSVPGVWTVRVIYLLPDPKADATEKTWILEDWRLDRLLRLELLSGRKSLVTVEGFVFSERDISNSARRAVAAAAQRPTDVGRTEFRSKNSVGVFKRMAHLPLYFLHESAEIFAPSLSDSGTRAWHDSLLSVSILIAVFTALYHARWSRPMTVLVEALDRMLQGRLVGPILRRRPGGGARAWWVHGSIQQLALHLEAVGIQLRAPPKAMGDSLESRLNLNMLAVLDSTRTPPPPGNDRDCDSNLDSRSEVATLMAPLLQKEISSSPRQQEVLAEPSSSFMQASQKVQLSFLLRIKIAANAQFPMETTFPGKAALEQIITWVTAKEGTVLWRIEDECVIGYLSPDTAIRMALEIRSKLRDLRFEQSVDWSVAMSVDVEREHAQNVAPGTNGGDLFDRGRRLIKLVKKINADLLVTQDALRESHLTYLIDHGSGYKVKSQGRTMNVIKIHGYISPDGERVTVRAPESNSDVTGTSTLLPINRENILWLDEQSRLAGGMNGTFADFGEIEAHGGGTGLIESNCASGVEMSLGSQSIATMGKSTVLFENKFAETDHSDNSPVGGNPVKKSPARLAFEQAQAERKRPA